MAPTEGVETPTKTPILPKKPSRVVSIGQEEHERTETGAVGAETGEGASEAVGGALQGWRGTGLTLEQASTLADRGITLSQGQWAKMTPMGNGTLVDPLDPKQEL
jgi:hypothetical protein